MLALRNAPTREGRPIAVDRARALSSALHQEFAIPFALYDGANGELVDGGEIGATAAAARPEVVAIALDGRPHASLRAGGFFRLVLPVREPDGTMLVAVGDLPAVAGSAQAARTELARLQKWLQATHARLSRDVGPAPTRRQDRVDVQQLRPLLEASRELTDLLGGLENPGARGTDSQGILRRAATVLRAGELIWVPCRDEQDVAIAGEGRLAAADCRSLGRWLADHPDWDPSGYLIRNDLPRRPPAHRFAGITHLMALTAEGRDGGGWLIALDKRQDGEIVPFRRMDVALLKPFAALLGLQSRSSRRESRVQDLFAGLVRSLTAAIDAKDPYTCGHSERVARISVELARELGLPEADLGDAYLVGLLHDIGKIGVPDSLLGKRGILTPEEFAQIAEHVRIGCRILEGFGDIAHLLPAVLSHHERFDGTGYPHGLKGRAIPLLARILAVADAFDAMDTARPYRSPLPRPEIEAILAGGRGRQWDAEVVDAFFRARDRIYAIHSRGVGDSVWFALHRPHRGLQPHFAGPGTPPDLE